MRWHWCPSVSGAHRHRGPIVEKFAGRCGAEPTTSEMMPSEMAWDQSARWFARAALSRPKMPKTGAYQLAVWAEARFFPRNREDRQND